MNSKLLDQFFTKPNVAELCWNNIISVLPDLTDNDINDLFFIEPSVGNGVFYDLLPKGKMHRIGVDIEPKRKEFIEQDFLSWDYPPSFANRENTVIIGNPPFGKRGDLAVQFFNKASTIADIIAFIVPVIFRKYFIHKELVKDYSWVYSTDLPRAAFTFNNKEDYEVNTEFQVWTRHKNNRENKRLFSPPPIKHKDFDMWQYNNTEGALKMFNNPFDFAVPSQGWQDYTRREFDANACEKNKQWMLFRIKDKQVYNRLFAEIDYTALSMKNTTSIPGFRKGDVVQEYLYLYG